MTAKELVNEWARKKAVPFDTEAAITNGVYRSLRPHAEALFDAASKLTRGFCEFDPVVLHEDPELLPILQHVAGVFSKAELKKIVGSVSDTGFSKPASQRLASALSQRVNAEEIDRGQVLQRLESTLEGVVRDLVGRLLLEDIVAHALQAEEVPFLREEEYSSLPGVVYDFRADFVIPDADDPVAFIEVRTSSSRHASLYAKDKMFSAINWKGRHSKLIGAIVVDGPWTETTLKTMASVFDYVIPLSRCAELAKTLRRAIDGDKSALKWLIEFRILPARESN